MPSKLFCLEPQGLHAQLIEIEVDTRQGLPHFLIVGLPDTAIDEARQRVESAIKNCGLPYPRGKIIVNLAPAHVHKVGAHYDLAIALGILAEMEMLDKKELEKVIPLGELALDGTIRPIQGTLIHADEARRYQKQTLMLPSANAPEASLIKDIEIIPVSHLMEAVAHFSGTPIPAHTSTQTQAPENPPENTWNKILGQTNAKRILEIAAAGHHSVLLYGPPGTGKTMLSKALTDLMPPLSEEEQIEITKIHSIGRPLTGLITQRPFRSIHPRSTLISLLGGGTQLKPGELSLAHRGVLLMDEFLEFPSGILESLRQPLEEKKVRITRLKGVMEYPASALVVGTMNPCPCGFFDVMGELCTCTANEVRSYQKKLSGPLLDRIELMAKTETALQNQKTPGRPLHEVRQRIAVARALQKEKRPLIPKDLNDFKKSADQKHLSYRSQEKALRVARTIADLEGSMDILRPHWVEALQTLPHPIKK
jgi:magnesium chelatase family protein